MMRLMRMAADVCTAVVTPKMKPKVLVIAGSTSVGKTDLSLELAKLLNGEIISADSVQVFRGMDIGSAKISAEESQTVPHHLIDIVDIKSPFSAGQFAEHAERAIRDIVSRGHVPMIVGGTGLYISTLMQGSTGAPPSTPASKAAVEDMVQRDGSVWEVSLKRLSALDPDYASGLEPNDWYRLKRALEICTLSGRTVTSFKREYHEEDSPFDFKCLFLTMPRVPLKQRIDSRCELIVQQGLFSEVIQLVRESGLVLDSQAGRSVGYRQALELLDTVWGFPSKGHPYQLQIPHKQLRQSFLDFLGTYQAKTRQLAGLQSIWFKKSPHFHWLNIAPDGVRVPVSVLAGAVRDWFTHNTPLPIDWDGNGLKEITKKEQDELKRYETRHRQLNIYCELDKVDTVLKEIERGVRAPERT